MKKITLLMSAMLFAVMSFAGVVTFTPADFEGQGTTGTGSPVTVTKDGVTVSCDKGYGTSYALRCYTDGVVTISATENIASLEFAFDTYNGRYYNGNLEESYTVGANTWDVKLTSQARFKSITVTLGEGGTTTPDEPGTEEPETPVVPEGAITCAEAVTICEKTGSTLTAETYTIRGYVTEIKYTWSEKYGTATFWIADTKDGGQVLQAYSCAPLTDADKVFAVGDYVELVGKLKKYNTTNEVEKGTYTVITAADGGETPEEPEEPETPVEPGETTIEIPAEAAAWDIPAEAIDVLQARAICAALQPGQNTGKKYYVMGYVKRLSSKHAEAVEKYKNARFYMENVKGGNSDEEFVAFQVKGIDGGDITNPDVVAAGDFVIVYGELTHFKYDANSDSDYETVGGGKAYIWKSTNPLLADTESGVEDVIVKEKMTKVIKNGQMYIIRDGKAYNVLGAQL